MPKKEGGRVIVGNNTGGIYRAVFKEYPDVLDVVQVGELLDVSTKTVYGMIGKGVLSSLMVGSAIAFQK